ncbi:non-ribosomal peptide synthetase [Azospirillum rugosum]|uniref:Amino acid adenylation domain-containing protein/thioester reductase-like protein n=1 Tax=Azospirillum rugosum TaxID=416170 RepID=A0ABS4SFG4_9PROT|nr:non-ribosomal peptide synthetase [Azospirillum rugosum]MBP2291311.1 amino acid adenylation domain-containing protein/thioester reductase-like protein [Azospirillum rugosum]MDQ0525099.1 amino acid adenylation domain-containing protein/thioester reductase-like protein [Azospirillum rugosum]
MTDTNPARPADAAQSSTSFGPVRAWPIRCLHEGAALLARSLPDAPAVIGPQAVVNWSGLDAAANAVAHALLGFGLGAQEPVGVLAERSGDLPLAFLGILKAGGVYVPMVADLPGQRLANMARQAGMRVVIALDGLTPPPDLDAALAQNARIAQHAILRPDALDADFRARHAHSPNRPAKPDDLAVILFTSGSTGQPKGVQIQHDACVNMALGHIEAQGIGPDDRILLSTSPGFILGFRELCLPLLSGAAYVPATRALIDDPDRLRAVMEERGVTIALFTPSYLRLFQGAVPRGLRMILTAGERPNADDARHYARHLAYWNMHGATEVCGTICMHRASPDGDGPLPSGRPFVNTAVHLLDKDGNEVPPGEIGEIHVVGRGVSRGYLNQPELTAENFVETRFGRAYRTHDLGRWNADGELEALGRADDMVKVSGQSVSLGEIERTLLRHPKVRRAAALQHKGRLVAFVESPQLEDAQGEDWRAYLAGALPAYMVPARVGAVPRMPISSAGKVDRQALLALADADRGNAEGTSPEGELETAIARVWEEVLDVRPVMRDDNFFAIGGTSLLAIQVGQRLRALGINVPVQSILATLTVAALARRVASDAAVPDDAPDADSGLATAGQEDFWIAAGLGLPAAGSHIVRVLSVRGPVPEEDRWQAAWAALLARHPALRTGFATGADGRVLWHTVAPVALPPSARLSVDRCHLPEEARELVAGYATTPFALGEPPLARAGLLRVESGDETLFWFVLHHAVVDGLSARTVQGDMLALLLGRDLPPVPHGVAVAGHAEQRYLASDRAERDRSFWRDRLDALVDRRSEAFDELPTDLRRPDAPSGRSAPPLTERLDAATVTALTRLAQAQGVGLHGLLLAILAAEARRRTGRADLILGTGVSLRPAGSDDAVGHFVNLLPIVLTATDGALSAQLRAAQASLTEAVEHADQPAGLIHREFRQRHPGARPPSRTSLFDIALTANPSRFSLDPESGLSFAPRRLPGALAVPAAGLDLAFSHEPLAEDEGGGLELMLLWNPDVYAEDTARAWLTGFAAWARWLAADANRLDAPLPALLPHEAALLERWEHGEERPRPDERAHRLFEALADRQPRRPAVVTRDGVRTYAALDAEGNRIANALLHHGVGPEEPVAVLADGSAELPAALLGVWKAGAAYLPLARDLPPERLAFMARDAGARLLIALDGHPVPPALAQAVEATLRPESLEGSTNRPAVSGTARDLAYIIYTSGTTGQPKGVAVPHGGLVNSVLSTGEAVGLRADDRMSLAATPGFDASLWELGLALLHGMALVPVSHDLRDDPWALKAFYAALGVTVAFHSPSYLRVSQDTPFRGLRVLLTGGEAPNADDARHHAADLAFWNAYGPTEASILVSMGRIRPDAGVLVPAGRPLPNTRVSLRRADGTPVPPGVAGELWLGGAGLARGYLNQPDLTAGSFVETTEGRFYRTGDLGRWDADGQLVLCGRIDHQVKLHGQRVELGEIEQALRDHPGVAEAVVLLDRAAEGTKSLRAFARPTDGATLPEDEDWRAFLADRLPVYMVPASVTPVASIPLTTAGKIDRDALLRLAHAQPHPGKAARHLPAGELETRIAALWADLLGTDIAREDNFFALGGNSLLAVTLAHRLSADLDVPVPARALFAAPTLAGFARKVADLRGADAPAAAPVEDDLATEGEREFWVAEAAGLDTRPFTIPVIRRIEGDMPAPERWAAAWGQLVARHEGLRTAFREDADGRLRRHVVPALDEGLETATALNRDSALAHIRHRQGEPFAMGAAPLWRAGLVAVEDAGDHLFWLALHHSVGDGRSVGILLEELTVLLLGDRLPPPAARYGGMAAREQVYLAGPACADDARHWDTLLAALPDDAFADWPLDTPRSPGAEPGSHRFEIRLDAATAAGLKALARRNEASLHALLLTLLAREVRRRTGRAEFTLGTTASTRETAADAQVVGYGVNMLPLAVRPAAGSPFAADLRATQATLAKALEHARYPFARMYSAFWKARPQHRDPARYPLFDIAVTENPDSRPADTALRLARLTAAGDDVAYERTGHSPGQDMVLIHEGLPDGGLLLQWHVNAALYARDTAEAWLSALAGWARWLAEDAARADLAPPALLPEEQELLAAWDHGPAIARPTLRFHELFEQALDRPGARQGDRPAVIAGDRTLTHRMVEEEANALAHALAARGVQPGSVVGVLTGRSASLPATLLGIWKASAVYLPLAADLPPERLAFMAADASVRLLVALDGVAVPDALAGTPVLRPEELTEAFRRSHAHRLGRPGSPEDTAYILYTSGSTGRPKGTLVRHAGYVNMVLSAGEILGLTPEDRTLMFASPSFDVSLSDIGVPLAFGAALCPVPANLLGSPARLLDFLAEQRVTVADITPTYLRLFGGAELPSLRALVTGGEAPLAADVRAYAGHLRYYNAYGPTENTITSAMGLLTPEDRGVLPVGRPLPNTSVSIRDAVGTPLPPGAVGEVWLGGVGLARGYLNRPEQDAAAFVDTPQGRLYRSGDLGRWRAGGELEILGRVDDQVKLNGIRIELGEIEHALDAHPAVAQAVALVDGKAGAAQSLWAFVRPATDASLPSEEVWRAWLADRLPAVMIPAAVIPVEDIPLTASGKVDRAALKALVAGRVPQGTEASPQGALEDTVARVWAEVLGRGPVWRDDNFFALGGQSLLAIAVAHRLESALGHPVPARELFAEPTLRGFAARIAALVPAKSVDAGSDRATEGQREFWVAEQAGLDTRGFNIPLTLAVEGELPSDDQWQAAWAALVTRHEALRTGFQEDAAGTLRRTVHPTAAALELDTTPDRATALARIRARQTEPFAMAAPPLWRAGLTRPADASAPLFWLVLHHSIGDGLSLGLLADELGALLRGEVPATPVPGFDRSAASEESYLSGDAGRADAAYWQGILGTLDPAAFDEWPLDLPRPAARTGGSAKGSHCHRLRLDPATAGALRAFAQRNGASLHALMLALMAQEVRRRTGRAEFLLGTATSTRETAGEAAVVGYYVNMLPLACRVRRADTVEQAIQAAQRTLAEGLRHSRYPFARIVRDFRRDHPQAVNPGRYPLFDIAVTENPGASGAQPTGLRFTGIDSPADGEVRYELRHSAPAQDIVLVHEGQADGGLVLQLYANAALYERETARAWTEALAGWARHLAGPDRQPDTPLPALLPNEVAQLAEWESGPAMPHPAACIHHRFAQLAADRPDAPAVITDTETISYAALDTRANALARALLALGVRRGEPVGVLTERSPALPEAVLAVWKAGAAYLPLTRDLPADRLAFIARDAGIRIVLALDGHPLPPVLADAGYAVLRPEEVPSNAHTTAPAAGQASEPGDLAYIIYTSGSTGVPKGVMLPHGGTMNLALSMARMLGAEPDERVLLSSSPSFDAWIADTVMAWAVGGALVPVRRAEMDDTAGMLAKMVRQGVTSATLPPSYLRLFEQADLPSLRILMTVGEPPNTADALHYAGCLRYYNGYGPTENTAAASIGRLLPGASRMTAGRPLPNTGVHILDEEMRPVPPGSIGQVWLSGAGLGIGYLNRPDLTAAAFVETPEGRRYRTGDLGRWLPDGELLILGRSDGQVKLRGQRVELGEIEHRLEEHPAVQQAVALVDTPAGGAQTLWAFVTLQAGAAEPPQAAWTAHVAEKLPAYMVPAAVIRVPAIPVTVAGKVDRNALLKALADHAALPGTDASSDDATRTPPRTAVEQRVAELWTEVLQRPVRGREDNFFELGGDSLRAIAAVNRLRREFACKINDLYEHPVLADFALRCKPQPDHLHHLVRTARAHWHAYQDGLAAYDAERDAALGAQQDAYAKRNRPYEASDYDARRDYGHALLTGGTGYLGAYLLRELLSDGERRVTALVRGGDDAAARARLARVLSGYFGEEVGPALAADPRLTVLAGDLRRDDLGLTGSARGRLAEETQAVFHCAANVNHFGHYREFHADNVEATRRLIDIAAGNAADFHLISTLSVTGKAPEEGFRLFTEYDPVPPVLDENYYVRSKQEAERLVVAARGELPNACIHRVGNVVYAAEGGPLQLNIRDNAFFRQLAAFVRLGVVPDDSHVWLCHVDRVARAVALLAGAGALTNETHHVENNRRDTLADFVTSARGMEEAVRAVGFGALLDRLERAIGEPAMDGALAQTMEAFGLYNGRSPQGRARRLELTSDRTQALLGRMGFGWPAVPRAGQADMLRAAGSLFA